MTIMKQLQRLSKTQKEQLIDLKNKEIITEIDVEDMCYIIDSGSVSTFNQIDTHPSEVLYELIYKANRK